MAAIDTSSSKRESKRVGVKRTKKLSTKVDLTPMVDLGFLLITFFIFTTTMNDPKAMKLNTPSKDGFIDVKQDYTMNILLGKNNKIYTHIGQLKEDASNIIEYNYNNVREGIMAFKKSIPDRDTAFMNIVIKPSDSASFRNTIDIVDEMTISDIKRYAKVDMLPIENELIEKFATSTNKNTNN